MQRLHPLSHYHRAVPVFRNPIYLAFVFILIGWSMEGDNSWLLLLLFPMGLTLFYLVIAKEEAYLTRRYGDGYLRYMARVRRWV